MPDLVLFRMEAPIAAFGDLAVGERRGSHRRPSHSAVAGLAAAALGLGRDSPGLEALADGFLLAVRTDAIGSPLADFHTAQTPPQRRGRSYATRRRELANKNDLGTIISRRDYWTDAAFTILMWPKAELAFTPQAIADALKRPVYALFAGRRACPLGAPLAARVIAAETLPEAFAVYDGMLGEQREKGGLAAVTPGGEIAFDAAFSDDQLGGLLRARTEMRRDRLVSRRRWQFDLREETVGAPPRAVEKGDAK
jgi:CRISPR system Cascade subunit CasD